MDRDTVKVNPATGRATYQATNMPMGDYGDSAFTGGTPVPGNVSFALEWAPSHDQHTYRYAPHRWEGTFVQTSVTCNWSGRTATSTFSSDTNNPTIFAEVGHERSGVFFH
ncbi:MAG: hypothetical protein NVS2B7_38250 [Herpetosiphon sp.]